MTIIRPVPHGRRELHRARMPKRNFVMGVCVGAKSFRWYFPPGVEARRAESEPERLEYPPVMSRLLNSHFFQPRFTRLRVSDTRCPRERVLRIVP